MSSVSKLIIEVAPSFLHRSHFTKYAETFNIITEDDHIIKTSADITVPPKQEWSQEVR